MKYVIKTGQLFDNQGHLIGVGYSGHGAGLNNPRWTHVVAVGPLPVGTYTVGDPRDPVDHLGPIAMPLEPADDNDARLVRAACNAGAVVFVTGDHRVLGWSELDGMHILNPRLAWLKLFSETGLN